MSMEKIEKVSKIAKKASQEEGLTEINEPQERMAPNKERFDSLMNAQQTDKVAATEKINEQPAKSSLMDEMRNLNQQVNRVSKVSPKELVAQADDVVHQINAIKEKLSTPNLDLKSSTQTLLQNKLSHIDENLRVALSKAGLEYTPVENLENKPANPIERFLGFLTNGQAQLASLSNEIEFMHLNNKEISPAIC
jgi:hypothetical protein